jgi:peroxiredoxin
MGILLQRAAVLFATLLFTSALDSSAQAQYLKSRDHAPAPEFDGVTEWINTRPLSMKKLRGKVVIVHFWTNGCFNCKNNYTHYRSWSERYKDKDVVIVGIHTPELTEEYDIDRIKAQAAKNGLTFPIAVDNRKTNWDRWLNRCWPTVYVVDRKGVVRYGWEGELNYNGQKGEEKVRKLVDALLEESP